MLPSIDEQLALLSDQREKDQLEVRLHRLELYIELLNAPAGSADVQDIHKKIQALESSEQWQAVQQKVYSGDSRVAPE